MLDHLARARELRRHAARCEVAAKSTTSAKFGDCYRLLAKHYMILAELEEDFVARQNASGQNVALLEIELIAAE